MKYPSFNRWTRLVFAGALWCAAGAALDSRLATAQVPGALVTAKTKQVYRFHFSGLHGGDAVRLAGQVWTVVSKLPPENPLFRTLQDAKDRETFVDDYRSLRNLFLEVGVDTVYFLADEFWIERKSLPGTVVIPGDIAKRDRLRQNLAAAGLNEWAAAVAQLESSKRAQGWLVHRVGAVTDGETDTEKRKIVEHALLASCPVKPASVDLGSLPAMRVAVNEATPFTIVNLERNKLDDILTQLLSALVPSSSRTVELSKDVVATTVTASAHPVTYVRQVAHLKSNAEATALAEEVQRQVNGAVKKVVEVDLDFGPLLGLFAQSMVIVSTHGTDVHMIMKPPALFDLDMAHRKSLESQDLDWTALAPPDGFHWEIVGSVGAASRADVFARVRAVRVRGGAELYRPPNSQASLAKFEVPFGDSELVVFRNLKGQLKVDLAKKQGKPVSLPALDLLDSREQLVAVLRLDLGSGDPRYDLARSRGVIAKRAAERKTSLKLAKKKVDDTENAHQRAVLENQAISSPAIFEEWQDKLRTANRDYSMERAAAQVLNDLDNQARETQRQFPGTTLVKNTDQLGAGRGVWAIDRQKFPFAGQWLFDYGVLTLHQDVSGAVAGEFASKVFHYTASYDIDATKPTTGLAILCGKAKGSTLRFTLIDYQGRERAGTLVLDPDGTGGKWTLDATDPLLAPSAGKTQPRTVTATPTKQQPKTDPRQPKGPMRGTLPFLVPATGNPLGLPPVPRKPPKGAEGPRHGNLDRLEVAAPNRSWMQTTPTGVVAGYWVHSNDKRMNILFKAQPSGLLEGAQGTLPGMAGNLRAAAAGQVVFVLENINMGVMSPSVREAVFADGGEKLRFLPPQDRTSTSGLFGRNLTPLELTRDRNE